MKTSLIQCCNCWSIFLVNTKHFCITLDIVSLPDFQKQSIFLASLHTSLSITCKKPRFKATKSASDLRTKTNHGMKVRKALKQTPVKTPFPTESTQLEKIQNACSQQHLTTDEKHPRSAVPAHKEDVLCLQS